MFDALLNSPPADSAPDRHEAILFGHDSTERIVAVEPSDRSLIVWQRLEGDRLVRSEERFVPWLLTAQPDSRLGGGFRALESGELRFLYEFATWGDFQSALAYVRDSHVEHLAYTSACFTALA